MFIHIWYVVFTFPDVILAGSFAHQQDIMSKRGAAVKKELSSSSKKARKSITKPHFNVEKPSSTKGYVDGSILRVKMKNFS